MLKKIHKLFFNYEKEEKWLNELSAHGLQLKHYSFVTYYFEPGEPMEYTYRIELLNNLPSHPESQAYIDFMADAGVEYVDKWYRWVYFRRKAAAGDFALYSDFAGRIKHYKKVIALILTLLLVNLGAGLYNLIYGIYMFKQHHWTSNMYISSISFLTVILLAFTLISYWKNYQRAKIESRIHE